jgi:DNA-binding Xre family transcriptional regulator
MLMIRVRFILESKGIANPYNYLVKNGFTPNTATRYLHGRVDLMNLDNLEKLCILLQCTPHDLLEWDPPSDTKVTQSHPLFPLIRNEQSYNIVKHINQLPLSKVKKVQEFIEKLKDTREDEDKA